MLTLDLPVYDLRSFTWEGGGSGGPISFLLVGAGRVCFFLDSIKYVSDAGSSQSLSPINTFGTFCFSPNHYSPK